MSGTGDLTPRQTRPVLRGAANQARPVLRTSQGIAVQPAPGQKVPMGPQPKRVDVCFVFDTTGSMYDKIDGLVQCLVDFVRDLTKLDLDWRITAVPFGDLRVDGDRVVGDLPFVATRAEAERLLRSMPQFYGGNNIGESSLEAVQAGLKKSYRADAVKVLVVLTDDYPIESPNRTAATVGRDLRVKEAICFVASPPLPGYKRWAEENGGAWYEIGPSMDTSKLLQFLRSLVRDVAKTARAVHEIGGGSVRRYLDSGAKVRGELPRS